MLLDSVKLATVQGQKKITNKMLSQESGVSVQQISNIRGGRRTTALTALRIARALGVPVEAITKKEE